VQNPTDFKGAKPASCHCVVLQTESHMKSWVARQCVKCYQNIFYSSWHL